METLSICVRLCEQGINPEALSSVIKELRKATEALKVMLLLKKLTSLFEIKSQMYVQLALIRFINCTLRYEPFLN